MLECEITTLIISYIVSSIQQNCCKRESVFQRIDVSKGESEPTSAKSNAKIHLTRTASLILGHTLFCVILCLVVVVASFLGRASDVI